MNIAKLALAAVGIAALAKAAAAIPRPGPVGNKAVPQPAKPVEIERYMGRWFEQFRYEASFQKDCEGVMADYSLNPDGSVKVVNSCNQDSLEGKYRQSSGKAKVVDAATNAKLKVSFFGPFYGDYWVLDHGDNYEWSIVGEPSGRYLWALTRDAQPSAEVAAMLEQRVKAMGYDWSLVRQTQQRRQ